MVGRQWKCFFIAFLFLVAPVIKAGILPAHSLVTMHKSEGILQDSFWTFALPTPNSHEFPNGTQGSDHLNLEEEEIDFFEEILVDIPVVFNVHHLDNVTFKAEFGYSVVREVTIPPPRV